MKCKGIVKAIVLYFFLLGTVAFSQDYQAENNPLFSEFKPSSPVDHPLRFSGTFGELRSGHFHMGLDVKSSRGTSGDRIYAIAEGYISRMKVETGGYGQAVYISHPEGLTSVYAHLDRLIPEIESIVRDSQRVHKTFGLDLHFDISDSIPALILQRRKHFAYMGTKGYSFGPHLHLEIRNTNTEIAYNPLLFGFDYVDELPPDLEELHVEFLSASCHKLTSENFSLRRRGKGKYGLAKDIVISPTNTVSLSLLSRDKMNHAPNRNGIYGMHLRVNNREQYHFQMDSISYSDTRYINAHMHYGIAKEEGKKLHRLYDISACQRGQVAIDSGNGVVPASIYGSNNSNAIHLEPEKRTLVEVQVYDFAGNTSTLEFELKYETEAGIPDRNSMPYNYFIPKGEDSRILFNNYDIFIPSAALYSDLELNLGMSKEIDTDCLEPNLLFHNETVPIHEPVGIKVDLNGKKFGVSEKLFLAKCDGGRYYNQGSVITFGFLEAKTREFGDFCVMADREAPEIKVLSETSKPQSGTVFKYKIQDNIRATRYSEPMKYAITLDDEYTYYELDAKSNGLRIPVSEMQRLNKERVLRIRIVDSMGNESNHTLNFHY